METRKIQKVGGSTYTVSVPKEWARKQGLETGEAVRLYTHRDGSLIVRGRRTDGESLASVWLPVTEPGVDAVEQSIQGAYEAGFERIALHAEEPFTDEQRRVARTVARRFVGTEVLDADGEGIVIRAMLDASAVSIRQSIDQAVSIVSTMQKVVLDRLAGDVEAAGQVGDRMTDVTRLVALIRRHYNRSLVAFGELDDLGIDRVPLSQYHRTADRIETVATATVHLNGALDGLELATADSEAIADRLTTLRNALERATKPVVEGGDPSAISVPSPFESQRRSAPRTCDNADPALARLFDQLRRIDDAVRAIERIGLQSAARSGRSQDRPDETGQDRY